MNTEISRIVAVAALNYRHVLLALTLLLPPYGAVAQTTEGTGAPAPSARPDVPPRVGQPLAEMPPTQVITAPKLSVTEILSRNAKARGGLDAWHRIKTQVLIGSIQHVDDVPGRQTQQRAARLNPEASQIVSFKLDLARPNKMRLELTYQGTTAIQAFDGNEGYTVQPSAAGPVARPFAPAQLHAAAEQQDLDGPLLDAESKGTQVTLAGIEAVQGRAAYKLTLTLKSGVTRQVWVDAQSFNDVKIDGNRQIGDRLWPVDTFFSDFRKVGDVTVPYQIETAIGGVHTMERTHILKVLHNVPLEATLFTLPKAPAAIGSATPPGS